MLLNDENISRAGNQWFEAKLIPEHKTRLGHRALSRVRSALANGINVTRNCGRVGRARLMALYLLALWHFPSVPELDTNNPCAARSCLFAKRTRLRLCNLHPRVHHIVLPFHPFSPSACPLRALGIVTGLCRDVLSATRKFVRTSCMLACIARWRRIHSAEIVTLRFFSSSAIPVLPYGY